MSELDQLTQIITTILGQDNQARRESENLLVQLRTRDLNQYVLVFVNLLNVSPRKEIRTFCSLHLRRLLSDYADDMSTSQWHLLTGEAHAFVKNTLIEVLLKETDASARKILCDLIGELVATIKTMEPEVKAECAEEGRQWDSIMQNVWTFLSSGEISLIGSGLKILGILFRYCSSDFVEHKEQLVPIIKQALEHDNLRIKTRAIEALSEYVENADSKDCKIFADMTPIVLQDILIIIEKDEDLGVEVMAHLTDMIEIEAKVFKPHFGAVFDALRNIAQNNEITTSALRENALETMTVLIEKFPKLSGKQENLVKNVYTAVFSYMITCVADPDKEWLCPPEGYLQNKEENESQEFSVKYCMDLFNRIIACLGQEMTLPTLSAMLQEMVGTNNWRYKYSALMALSQVGEHMGEIMEMDPIVSFTLNFLKDENPKVRYAALHCIGQLSDDKRFEFQKRYSNTIVPAIIGSFSDPVPRVLAHSLAALTNFLEGCTKKGVEGIIPNILEPCLGFLDTGISLVKENSISTIAALAEASRDDFTPYWQKTAEIIFNVLKNVHQREYKQLRGQAIECLTLIGDAVGKEEFRKAAVEIIQTMIYIQQNHVEETDPQKAYLLAGWQRLSSIFKQEFTPYLKEIIPSLFNLIERTIQTYQKKQDATYASAEGANGDDEEEKDAKGLLYRANTSESEEVVLAVKMISTFLNESAEGYLPYVEKTSQILGYLLSKSKNDNVRLAASKALPGVIRVLKSSRDPEKDLLLAKTSNIYLNLLWSLYAEEIDIGNLITYITSMRDVIIASGRYMDDKQIGALSDNILGALRESDSRKSSNQEQLEEDANDIDEDQFNAIQEENEKEEELHCTLADLINALFMTHQELTLPLAQLIFKQVLPNALNSNSSPKVQKFGLLLVSSMVDHLGLGLIPEQLASLAEVFVKFIVSANPEVRDTAALGMGILVEKSKENFQPLAEVFVKVLIAALTMKPRKEEDQRAYWRARVRVVVALGKIIKFQSQFVSVKEIIQIWFKNLPLSYYVEEARPQHELLVDIILESDPALIFGDNGQNLAYAVKVFAQLVHTRLCFETFQPKMKKIIEGLMANPSTKTLLEEAVKGLEPDLQVKLQKALEQK